MSRWRRQWPLLAGLALALIWLIVRRGDAVGWIVGMGMIAAGLAGQLLQNGRISLERERRLVRVAAELRELSARLELQATTDSLTGLHNRRSFFDRFGVEYRRSLRYRHPLSVLMADLDHFKDVNDAHGHPFGDLVLSVVGQTLRSNVRESDLAARYGGEEFVLMLPETGRQEALVVAEKLRAAVAAQEITNGIVSVHLTVSIGVATLPDCGPASDEDFVRLADEALYAAKRGGRDRAVAAPVSATIPE